MLVDRFGRRHTKLRVSVTDRCNLRCTYCMPAETPEWQERQSLLTFEEIERFVRVAAALGVTSVRLTGGEPLVRRGMDELVRKLVGVLGAGRVSLTTNGLLLEDQIDGLVAAGLRGVNVSLDALDEEAFRAATRRDGLDRVLSGIESARRLGVDVKINAIAMRGLTEDQLEAFGHFTRGTGLPVRFIEFMPLDAGRLWSAETVLSADEILDRFMQWFPPLVELPSDPSVPATDYTFADGLGQIGIIASVTKPFCGACNRFRLTAEGQIRSCLFGDDSADVRALLRQGAGDDAIAVLLQQAIAGKRAGHGTDDLTFLRPDRAMYTIGG